MSSTAIINPTSKSAKAAKADKAAKATEGQLWFGSSYNTIFVSLIYTDNISTEKIVQWQNHSIQQKQATGSWCITNGSTKIFQRVWSDNAINS
jgi:hypothetical protein